MEPCWGDRRIVHRCLWTHWGWLWSYLWGEGGYERLTLLRLMSVLYLGGPYRSFLKRWRLITTCNWVKSCTFSSDLHESHSLLDMHVSYFLVKFHLGKCLRESDEWLQLSRCGSDCVPWHTLLAHLHIWLDELFFGWGHQTRWDEVTSKCDVGGESFSIDEEMVGFVSDLIELCGCMLMSVEVEDVVSQSLITFTVLLVEH